MLEEERNEKRKMQNKIEEMERMAMGERVDRRQYVSGIEEY